MCHFSSLFMTALTGSHNVTAFKTKQSKHKEKISLRYEMNSEKEKQKRKVSKRKVIHF